MIGNILRPVGGLPRVPRGPLGDGPPWISGRRRLSNVKAVKEKMKETGKLSKLRRKRTLKTKNKNKALTETTVTRNTL